MNQNRQGTPGLWMAQWGAGLLLVGLLLGGYGGAATPTPEAVHAAWIAGLRGQNRAALVALMPEKPMAAVVVDESLETLWDRIASALDGPLEAVTLLGIETDAKGAYGVSFWQFRDRPSCYRTRLVARNGTWTVDDWGLLPRCPAGTP